MLAVTKKGLTISADPGFWIRIYIRVHYWYELCLPDSLPLAHFVHLSSGLIFLRKSHLRDHRPGKQTSKRDICRKVVIGQAEGT